jgi:hypothetical protein
VLQLLILAIVVGAVIYVVRLLPIDETFKAIVTVIAVVVFAIYAIRLLAPMIGLG